MDHCVLRGLLVSLPSAPLFLLVLVVLWSLPNSGTSAGRPNRAGSAGLSRFPWPYDNGEFQARTPLLGFFACVLRRRAAII